MSSSTVPNPISSIIERLNQVESYVHVFANKTNEKLANQASVLQFLSDDLIQFNHEFYEFDISGVFYEFDFMFS